MKFSDLEVGQKFKFAFDRDTNFVYEKTNDIYFTEITIPPTYGEARFAKYDIRRGALSTSEVINVVCNSDS